MPPSGPTLRSLVMALLLLLGGVPPLHLVPPAWALAADEVDPEPAEAEEPSEEELRLLELINEARAEAGLSPVILDETLSRVARTHAREMIDRGYFGHISPTHGSPGRRVREAGLSFSFVGENLAGHTSVTASHRALLASAAHRRNILHPEVEWVGLAYVRGGPYGGIIVELFVAPEREPAEGLED